VSPGDSKDSLRFGKASSAKTGPQVQFFDSILTMAGCFDTITIRIGRRGEVRIKNKKKEDRKEGLR
jgi:hypothetical protein